ncbi:MAG: DMT family transporter [Firmicutes bacterium]|nr:DMT family transporter [Bacillota bacterium]
MEGRKNDKRSMAMLVASMAIWGSIGIFRRYIPLPSSVLAASRGVIGSLFLFAFLKLRGRELRFRMGKKLIVWYAVAGAIMAFNWVFLFEAYNYTSIAIATLCYYMMPVFVTLASAVLFGERLTARKLICVAVCLFGMLIVTGVIGSGLPGPGETKGILLGLGAAVLYAVVVLMNKKVSGVDPFEKTIVQLLASSAALVPYLLLTVKPGSLQLSGIAVPMLLVVGILHTGIPYALYFGCTDGLRAQTVAIFGYLDPIVAVLLSALLLGEPLTVLSVIGVVLVIGGAIVSEL